MRCVSPLSLGEAPALGKYIMEAEEGGEVKQFVLENIQRFCEEGLPQVFFCSTVYVVNEKCEFLLILHKKLKKFVPPGGKIDNHETPEIAAVRETLEETGLNVKLVGPLYNNFLDVVQPFGIEKHILSSDRAHVDFIYLGFAQNSDDVVVAETEASEFGWFSLEQIKNLNTFDGVVKWCCYFADFLKNREAHE